jgi:GT2 family glycosyltransferase
MRPLTIGITTRNRPRAVERCVRSLACLGPLASRVLVFDDASEEPVAAIVARAAADGMDVAVIRDEQMGYIAGRNRMVNEAATPYVLLLDDDAVVFGADPVERAIAVLDGDPNVAAVAFAQGEADGSAWPERMQPGRGHQPTYVAAFIGFAHLVRRDAFLRLGGYRESLVFYGEEKDFCVRALEAGLRIVYLPDAIVGHVTDPGGRSSTRYVRFVIRNDCLYSLYNEPWPLVALSLPLRLWRYRKMAGSGAEPGGLGWILRELRRSLPEIRRDRRAVSWATIREWRRMARTAIPYRLLVGDRRPEAGDRVSTDVTRDKSHALPSDS